MTDWRAQFREALAQAIIKHGSVVRESDTRPHDWGGHDDDQHCRRCRLSYWDWFEAPEDIPCL